MKSLLQRLYNLEVFHREKDDNQIKMQEYLNEIGFIESDFNYFIQNKINPKLYQIFKTVTEEDSKFFILVVFVLDYIYKLIEYKGKFLEGDLDIGDAQFILFDSEYLIFPNELVNNKDFIDIMKKLYNMNL